MTFEELMEKLKEAEGFGEDSIKTITARISKPNSENKKLRMKVKTLEADLQKENPVLKALKSNGFEIEEDDNVDDSITGFLNSLKATNKNKNKEIDISKLPELVKAQKEIAKLMQKSELDDKKNAELLLKNTRTSIENKLLKPFSEHISNGEKVLNLTLKSPDNPFIIDENNKLGFKLDDGDVITGTKEIIEEYKKLNPGEVKNISKSGNDTKQGDNFEIPNKFTSKDQLNSLSTEQWLSMTPEQTKQANQVLSKK